MTVDDGDGRVVLDFPLAPLVVGDDSGVVGGMMCGGDGAAGGSGYGFGDPGSIDAGGFDFDAEASLLDGEHRNPA